jgi:hypothetical protein
MDIKYQLVLQWPSKNPGFDYDRLVETEDLLIQRLPARNQVDGHDAGSGETNIFILTSDPVSSFEQVKAILEDRDIWATMRAAYREISGDELTILWPKNLMHFDVS